MLADFSSFAVRISIEHTDPEYRKGLVASASHLSSSSQCGINVLPGGVMNEAVLFRSLESPIDWPGGVSV